MYVKAQFTTGYIRHGRSIDYLFI